MEAISEKKSPTRGLNSNQLKLIAIIAMTVDHLASTLWQGYRTEWWIVALHIIGRLTAPIMWFFIAEGYHYTHNVKKYAMRLFIFAVISHFAYCFAFGIPLSPFTGSVFNRTSVIWPLAWGLVITAIFDSKKTKVWQKWLALAAVLAITFPSDWSCIAVLAIMNNCANRGNFKKQMLGMMIAVLMYTIVYMIFIDMVYGAMQMFVALSIPLLKSYNGTRGNSKSMKWFFYIYYPLHLALCGALRLLLH